MRRSDLYKVAKGVELCASLSGIDNLEFVYRIGIINEAIIEQLKQFEKVRPKISDEYTKFTEEQRELVDKYAKRDENVYNVVQIGTQYWIKQNWKCTHLNNGTEIPEVTNNTTWAGLTTGALCAYDNDWNYV